jgi:RNA-binding protein YhbY
VAEHIARRTRARHRGLMLILTRNSWRSMTRSAATTRASGFQGRLRVSVGEGTVTMLADKAAFERHYRIGELAELWQLGRETVRLLVKDEPDVIKVRFGRKKSHTTYSVPASVATRIHTKLLNP